MKRAKLALMISFSFSIVSILLAIATGSVNLSLAKVTSILLGFSNDQVAESILFDVRVPRVLLAFLIGGSLALSGLILQALLRNPLADPYVLGVSSGSCLGAVLCVYINIYFWGVWTLPFCSFIGAAISIFLVLQFSNIKKNLDDYLLILSGVIVSSLLGAISNLLLFLIPSQMNRIQFWMLGSFNLASREQLLPTFVVLLVSLIVCYRYSLELDILHLGDLESKNLGLNAQKVKLIFFLVSSLLTAVSVSFSGVIGFIGLIIPHICRLIIGLEHKFLIPMSILLGGSFTVLVDLLVRFIFNPIELSIGIVTGILGAPIFAFILRSSRNVKG